MNSAIIKDSLGTILNEKQLKLLSDTLQLSKNENNKNDYDCHYFSGLCPQLKLNKSFVASFTGVDNEENLLNKLSEYNEAFLGFGKEKTYTLEEGKVNLNAHKYRQQVWDKQATRIQSCWRGMKTRENLLS